MRGLILLAVLLIAGQAVAAEPQQVYEFYCAQCHGFGGKGDGINAKDFSVSPKDFTNTFEMNKLTDVNIKEVILGGGVAVSKSSLMPPWGASLTKHEVGELVGYLRKLCKCG